MKRFGEALAVGAVLTLTACSGGEQQAAPTVSSVPKSTTVPETAGPVPANCHSQLGGVALSNRANNQFTITKLTTTAECGNLQPALEVLAYDKTFMTLEEHSVESLPLGSSFEATCIGYKPSVLGVKSDAPSAVVMYSLDVSRQIEDAVGPLPYCEPAK